MTTLTNIMKTSNPSNDDLFLCHTFAKDISSDKLLHIIEQQSIQTESFVPSISSKDNIDCSLSSENIQSEIDHLCLCRYIDCCSSCTISFNDNRNEQIHPTHGLTDTNRRARNIHINQ